MQENRIYSENALFQQWAALKTNRKKRNSQGAFLVEGVRSINAALDSGWGIQALLYAFDQPLSRWGEGLVAGMAPSRRYAMPFSLLQKLSDKEDTSEVLAVVDMRAEGKLALPDTPTPMFVLFDRPSNKGNLGTVLRSCDGMGVDGLMVTGHAVDLYDPEVIRASMGSFFKVPFLRLGDNEGIDEQIRRLREGYPGLVVVATTAHRKTAVYEVDLTRPVLLLIGNETEGLNRHLVELSDVQVTVPMAANAFATSLNVGCAATILFYETMRQRAQK